GGAERCGCGRPLPSGPGAAAEGVGSALLHKSLAADDRPGAQVLNWVWLALAYQRLGKPDEALRWLDRANRWLDQLGDEMPINADRLGLHLHNWLEAHLLRKEAAALLRREENKRTVCPGFREIRICKRLVGGEHDRGRVECLHRPAEDAGVPARQ